MYVIDINTNTKVFKNIMKLPNIYEYYNYRQYLRDYYDTRKQIDRKFSYRFFAQVAGYNSSGLYKNIVEGINNLTPTYIPKFQKALKLTAPQLLYFNLIINYTHETNADDRDCIFKQMMLLQPANTKQLKRNQMKFFSKWHHVAIHQALSVIDFTDNFTELARFINPPIKTLEARQSIDLLQKLELIKKDDALFWRPAETSMVGSKEVGVTAIHEYQNLMMDQAKLAQSLFPREERHIITQTVAATDKALTRIKEKINSVQEEIITIVQEEVSDSRKERVYQLNIQYFPLSNNRPRIHHESE